MATKGWQNWVALETRVYIASGSHSLGLALTQGAWNFNWIEIVPVDTGTNDEDQDGVEDALDQRPGTAIGIPVDDRGCAHPTSEFSVMSFNVRTADAPDSGEAN